MKWHHILQMYRNQISPNCAMCFNIGPTRFPFCASKLEDNWATVCHLRCVPLPVVHATESKSVRHCPFAPRKTISTRPLAVWSTPRVAPAEPHPLQQTWIIADSNDFVLGSLTRLKNVSLETMISMNRTGKEMEKAVGPTLWQHPLLRHIRNGINVNIFWIMETLSLTTMGIMVSLPHLCPNSSSSHTQTSLGCSPHQQQNFPERMRLGNWREDLPNLRANQLSSNLQSVRHNSSHHQNKNCQCNNLSMISNSQTRQTNVRTLFFVRTSWTPTGARTDDNLGSFVFSISITFFALSIPNTLGRWLSPLAFLDFAFAWCDVTKTLETAASWTRRSVSFSLAKIQENWSRQHSWDQSVLKLPIDSAWNRRFSIQTSPPRTSRFTRKRPQTVNKKRFNFLRPLLKIVVLVNELLPLAEAFYIDETRRVFRTWTATKLWMARTAPATRDRQLELPTWSFLVGRVWQCVFSSANSQQNWLRPQLSTRDTTKTTWFLAVLPETTNQLNCRTQLSTTQQETNNINQPYATMMIQYGHLSWIAALTIYGSFSWIVFLTIQKKCSSTKCE